MADLDYSSGERTTAETMCTPPRALSAICRDACLVHIYPSGPSMGRRYPLSVTSGVTIGRGADCAVHIDDNSVSRKHARVEPTSAGFVASDLGSTNGTFVNDRRVTVHRLYPGDVIKIGSTLMLVR